MNESVLSLKKQQHKIDFLTFKSFMTDPLNIHFDDFGI